jgi:CheY-like chemotaxis protein
VNLAAGGTLATAAALRAARLDVPLWGCIVPAGIADGAALGRFDVLARPVVADAVYAQLAPGLAGSGRVVTVGSDGGMLLALRQGLSKTGVAVRTAWDFKQAGALLDAAMPDVVVLDLAQPALAAAEFVVRLLALEAGPRIVLVPAPAKDVDEFADALASLVGPVGGRSRADLLAAAVARR